MRVFDADMAHHMVPRWQIFTKIPCTVLSFPFAPPPLSLPHLSLSFPHGGGGGHGDRRTAVKDDKLAAVDHKWTVIYASATIHTSLALYLHQAGLHAVCGCAAAL